MESKPSDCPKELTLETVRESLIRQEDTIIFSLIERAKYPMNSVIYKNSSAKFFGLSCSLLQYVVKETEVLQATVGRYVNPEEHPFFLDDGSCSHVPFHHCPQVLHPAANSINKNNLIWDMYLNNLLPLFVVEGDDGNYASTAASDLSCLQALSRRIHYGNFVAEVKFKNATKEYSPAIRAKDRDALMKLLTFESVEEMVKRRVEKKAALYGQEVRLNGSEDNNGRRKIDPTVVSRLYGDWIMPYTKLVQVEYLLQRLH